MPTVEHRRLKDQSHLYVPPWKKWGPYVSDRAWGTVREDYSADGEAWDYFPHDHARSRVYRWGEDGIAAISDRYQILVFAPAFWNGRDSILKERLFGLAHREGNHGEDVKEYYFYLDSTPTHSYMKFLYKYPHAAFPYEELIGKNKFRSSTETEFELMDTGIFDEDRYFDIFVEYAKADAEDICIRIEVFNRGPETEPIHVLPHLWFRNTWSWWKDPKPEPEICENSEQKGVRCLCADDSNTLPIPGLPFHYKLGKRYLYGEQDAKVLLTNNETHGVRVFGPGAKSRSPYVKDAFHRSVIQGEDCLAPARGTKSCFHLVRDVPSGGSVVFRLRLSPHPHTDPLKEVDSVVALRRKEADEYYNQIQPPQASEDERRVQRQAFAGLLWSKQFYYFNVHAWLDGDLPEAPPPPGHSKVRNMHWKHLGSMRIMSMPDKWEYPWFAAWDLAFQCVPFTLVDPDFAKEQLWLLLFEQFQHPNGQIPAYEWEFSDLNPPVHAWAVWRVYNMDRIRSGVADRDFLEKCFHKLLINFTWWVNKVDRQGNNVFEGGFLGLDNITVVDRSKPMPEGAVLEQSDATGWMGMFCLNMMRIALELAKSNKTYEGLATKFFQHYVYIGAAMKKMGGCGYQLWDEKDGFFYDVLRYADGSFHKFRVRSLVGLIPLFAVERLEMDWLAPFKEFSENLNWFLNNRKDLVQSCVTTMEQEGGKKVHVLSIIDPPQIIRLLERVEDPMEFHSPFGLRSLSKYHEHYPYRFGEEEVRYEPGESVSKLKGGNSNWRGPVWFPTSFMMIEAIRKLRKAYGPVCSHDHPSKKHSIRLKGLARGLANRLISLFHRHEDGKRPIYGQNSKFQNDTHWRDYVLFHEYFHGDTGEGLGASHQTGWTALIASLIDEWRRD